MISWGVFIVGLLGLVVNRGSIIRVLVCIELMLVGVNMGFMLVSVYNDDIIGQVFGIMVLTVAAAESAIGLGILICYYRVYGEVGMEKLNVISG